MSPLAERMAVYLWLLLIDRRLPPYLALRYSHELQSMTLKDLQPRLSENMDTILKDMNAQEDVRVQYSNSTSCDENDVCIQYSRSNSHPSSRRQAGPPKKGPPRDVQSTKTCYICKAAGRMSRGHDVRDCWFTSKFEKLELAKALQVAVDVDYDDCLVVDLPPESTAEGVATPPVAPATQQLTTVQKVQCDLSPFFYAFHRHNICRVVVDTGATSSMVSRAF